MLVPIDEPPCYSSRTQKSTKKPKAWWLPFFTPHRRQCCPSPTRTYRQGTVIKEVSIFLTIYLRPRCSRSRYYCTHLTDILVPHSADLLDVCSALGDSLEGVAAQDQLILLGLGDLDVNTLLHDDTADELLANEVAVKVESCQYV